MKDEEGADPVIAAGKAYRQRLHERGLCIQCRKPVEPERSGRQKCAACADKMKKTGRLRKDRLEAGGICIFCGKVPARPGFRMCLECACKCAEYERRYREAVKTRGQS